MTRARKSQGQSGDSPAKTLPSGGQPEMESSPVKLGGSPKKTPRSSKKGKNASKRKKTPVQNALKDNEEAGHEAMGNDDDGVVTFNFKATHAKNQIAAESVRTGGAKSRKRTATDCQVGVPQVKPAKSDKGKQKSTGENPKSDNEVDTVAMETPPASESAEVALDMEDVAMETAEKIQRQDEAEVKEQLPSDKKRKSKKRKASHLKNDIPTKKRTKLGEDIFFYCGNLPPGVTGETLRYFLEEEGIHPKIFMRRRKTPEDQSRSKLTPKQRQYKKNVIKDAKSHFATVIVKTEEDARKMSGLNGISMPSSSHTDWDTELKIVRRLPRPDKFPNKVHVSGLHPSLVEEDLRGYLETHGIKPGVVLIIRRQNSQKSRRYGFVWFESVAEANKAVDLPQPILCDQSLVIQHSFKNKKEFKNF